MNYRHAFHAGNFADVVKHAVLALLIERLKEKEPAFRVIDTHAGRGFYDLGGDEASRTGEWRHGIGRVYGRELEPGLATLLAPYLAAVEAANAVESHSAHPRASGDPAHDGSAATQGTGRKESPTPPRSDRDNLGPRLRGDERLGDGQPGALLEEPGGAAGSPARYPGSPWIARHLLRRQDRLTAVDLHPEDAAALAALFAGDRQVKAIALDGYLALGSFVPPKERRGLVLVDPPFEERDEFERLLAGLANAHRRWPTGIYALWYPVKDLFAIDRFRTGLAASGIRRTVLAELTVRERSTPDRFNGAGLVICNPPWRFDETLAALLAGLVPVLADDTGAAFEIEQIARE